MLAKVGNSPAQKKFYRPPRNNFRPKMSKEEKRKLKCSHCGENGHEARECFKLRGYPEWFEEYKEQRSKDQSFCVIENENHNTEDKS